MESENENFQNLGKMRFTHKNPKNIQLPQLEQSLVGLSRRRTSAEMISEAKSFLSDVGGATTNVKNSSQSSNGIFFPCYNAKIKIINI